MNQDLSTTGNNLPTELQEQISALMKEDKGVAYDPLPIKVSLRTDRWWFNQKGSEEPIEKRDVLVSEVILARKTRAAYGTAEQKVPSCVSLDGCRTGTVNEKYSNTLPVHIQTGQPCRTCPLNQFGTGRDKQGNLTASKFCGERRLLLAFVSGFDEPLVISIPTMSTAAWDSYQDKLAKYFKTSPITQITEISIGTKQRSASNDEYGVAKFETKGFSPRIPQLLEARKIFSEMLGQIMTQAESEAPDAESREVPESPEPLFEEEEAAPF